MQLKKTSNPLVVIIGPTAVGKTNVAIELAKRFDGEIISADSRLFYRGMDIGTAKPSVHERQGVLHHLIDIADVDEIWSLAAFQKAAIDKIEEVRQRQKLPFLVGGTGQYIQAVVEGWQIPAQQADHRFRAILEAWANEIGTLALFDKLKLIDPEAAAHIEYQNVRRTIRALEVIFLTGKKFSDQRNKLGSSYSVLEIGLIRPRSELYERIDRRIEEMIGNGLVDEVQGLLKKGFSPDLPSFSAIGYREIIANLQGEIPLSEAVVKIKRKTREFVRRQANWFKENDPQIHWLMMSDFVVDQAAALILEDTDWFDI
jgi:tRNA dimethylallyltransferase